MVLIWCDCNFLAYGSNHSLATYWTALSCGVFWNKSTDKATSCYRSLRMPTRLNSCSAFKGFWNVYTIPHMQFIRKTKRILTLNHYCKLIYLHPLPFWRIYRNTAAISQASPSHRLFSLADVQTASSRLHYILEGSQNRLWTTLLFQCHERAAFLAYPTLLQEQYNVYAALNDLVCSITTSEAA